MNTNDIYFSFDDEFVKEFHYGGFDYFVTMFFDGYFDTAENVYRKHKCSLTISNWKDVYNGTYPHNHNKKKGLSDNMGIVYMILDMEFKGNILSIVIETIDERFVDIDFIDPEITFTLVE